MATTVGVNSLEKWVIGADKKPKFTIKDKTAGTNIALSVFSGYGVIIYDPDGNIAGQYGVNLTGYSSAEVSSVDVYTFQVALDKSLNTIAGTWKYHIYAVWSDSAFDDTDYDTYNDTRESLYYSVEL